MANIAGYIANLGKSVAYSASDKMKKMTPATSEFVNTNGELFKSVYSNIRDYKVTYKRSVDLFQKSKIYEAGDTLKTSLFEDIKSGKLYNKEREDKMSMKMLGMSDPGGNDGFDDSMLNFDDFDYSDITDFESDDFTTGDKIVSATIDSSSRKSAEMISKVTARTGEYIVESQKMSTNILYTQNMQGFGMLNSNLTSINENIGQMINFSNDALGQHVKVSADYYTKNIELMQDQTALLREIAGYLKPSEKKEEKNKEKITYDDIVGAEGMPDLKLYMQRVKKNIEANSGLGMLTSMNNMFGEDGNALATLMASPLKFIPNYIVNSVVPNAVEASMKDLDKSFGNLFGSLVAKLNTMAKDDNDKLASTIGTTFGVSNSTKRDIDTSKYEKGKVDWDGKSRKALIEVIPTQLAKIVSLLSGQEESVYDYDKGKFIKASSIKNEYKNKLKSYSKSATSDMRDFFEEYSKLLTFNSIEEQKKFKEDIDKFFTKLYEDGRMFDVNSKTLDEDHMNYGIDSKNFRAIRALYKNAPRHMQHSINSDILSNRNNQSREFEALEKDGTSNLVYMFNGSNINEFIKENKLDKGKTQSTSLLARGFDKITDTYGKNIFYYLQNMYRELSYIRQYGTMSGNNNNMAHMSNSMKITSSDGSEYVPEGKTINDIIIPRNKQYSDSENKARQEERARQKFIQSERKRIEKNQSLIKYSDIDDDKILENHLSAMIKVDQEKKRLELEKKKKKSLVDNLLEAGSLSEKTSLMFSKLNDVTSKPMKFVTGIIENVDKRMYEFIYGKEDANGDIKGFLDLTLYELKNTFNKFNSFLDEKILTPLKEKLDADTMKDAFKNLLGKMGIDVDHMSETIKSFFFGEKDADGKRKGGIFGETIEATKQAGKDVFGFVKESFKDTFSPIINKGKDLFKSKNEKLFKDLDEDDENVVSGRRGESLIQERINNLTDRRYTTGKTQEYYESMDWDSEENKNYYIKHNYIGGMNSIDSEEQELQSIKNELNRLKTSRRMMRSRNSRNRLNEKIKRLEERKRFLENNISSFHENKGIYTDQLKDKKYNNIKKYYSKNLSSALGLDPESDGVEDVLTELFESNKEKYKASGFKDFTTEDFMRSARKLSKSTGDDKYESVIDTIANYMDKYYGSDISKKLSLLADDSGKLIDPDNWYRTEGLPTTAEEFYKEFPNLINSNDLLLEETKESNSIFTQIADDIRALRDMFSSIGKNRNQQAVGPRVGLRPELINNPEGRATYAYAQDLATMIANWMYGNMSHFDEGGYIHKPMVATVGEGEVVLSKDNVDRLTSIFNELIGDVKNKKKSLSGTATTAFDKLLPMVKNGELKDLSVMDDIIKENPELNKSINTMDFRGKVDYKRVVTKLNNALINKQKPISELDPVQQALYQDTKPFVEKMGEELISGLGSVKRSLFGTTEKDDKKNFGDMITDVTSNISTYAPKAIGAGIVGGGISLLTGALGGPLLGAAVGAGISLTKQSESIQKFLFGELDENGERKGGLIGKNTQDIFKKYIPDMGKLGLVGGLVAPLITPLGPVGGIIAGSALGFAKNNKDVMDTLFGEKGFFRPKDKEKLEKLMPKLAVGAGIGALTGPFGLMGNILLGSGISMLTTTDSFREAIFGKYNDSTGEFESGLLPSMREYIINPLKENASDYKDTFFEYLREQIFKPVTSAIDPIRTEIAYMVKRPFEKLEEMIVEKIDKSFAPLRDAIQDKFVKPLTDKAKWLIGGIFKIAGNIIASPFKAIGAVGDKLRMKQIAQGRATYMTAEERIEARNLLMVNSPSKAAKFMKKDKTRDMDMMLSTLSKEDPSKIAELADMVNGAVDSKNYILSKRKSLGNEIGGEIGQYFDHGRTKAITKALSIGDTRKVYGLIENLKMREDIPEEKRQELISSITSKVDNFTKLEDTRYNQKQVREDMYNKLKEMGIKDISEKNLKKYQKYINTELKNTKNIKSVEDIQGPITPELAYYKESIDLLKTIADSLVTSNELSKENKTVTEELKESITGETTETNSSEENKPVINQMVDGVAKTEVDSYGNVIELKRSSDGELEADMSDASTAKAISIANEDREIRNSFMSNFSEKMSGLFGKKENSEDEDDNKGLFGILGSIVPLLTKLLNPKTIGGIATAAMAAPGFLKVLDAYKEGGIEGAISVLPSIVSESVATGLTKIAPAAFKGVMNIMENIGSEDDNILTNTKDTMVRQIATGGALKTAPESLMKVGKKLGLDKKTTLAEKAAKTMTEFGGVKGVVKLMSPFTWGKLGAGAAASIPKVGTDVATKIGGKVSGLYSKLDGKTGLKAFSDKISDAFVTKTIDTMDKLPVLESNINSLLKKIVEALNKLFDHKYIKNLFPAEKLNKLISDFTPKFISLLEKQLVKQGDKIAAKIAGALGTGGILNIIFAVGDFVSGYNNAKDILSITDEPTLGMKFACGILKSLNGLFIITSLIPEKVYVDIVLEASKAIFGGDSDLQKMREEAKRKAKEYKKENNITGNFDVQDYNKALREENKKLNPNDRNGDGKVTAIETVLNWGSNIIRPITNFGKSALNTVKSWGSSLWNGVTGLFNAGKGKYVGKGGKTSNTPSRVNNFSYFSQYDNRWDNDENSLLKKAGCGPTSVAMLLSESLGKQITPNEISSEAYAKGLWNEKGSSSDIFSYFGNKYNIPVKDVKKDWNTFDQLASQGVPQAVSGKGTAPYTTEGHIITVLGKDANGNYIVNDPLSIQRSKPYTISDMKNGWNNSWAFGGDNLLSINDSNIQNPEIVGLGNDAKIKMYEKVIQYARAFKGKLKYSMGSDRTLINKNGLTADCSSFTQHVFKTVAGIDIGANTGQQLTNSKATRLKPDEGQPGDLILFKGTYNSPHPEGVSHVGIISDNNGNMIDQGSSGAAPKERSYNSDYWKPKRLAAMRVLSNPNELVDPKVVGGNTAVGDVIGSSLGLSNSGEANNNSSSNSTTTQPETGISGLLSDLSKAATSTINKIYKFDTLSGMGMGGVDETIVLPTLPKREYDPKWNLNGQGEGDTKTVKSIKGIPIGTKQLNDKVLSYKSIFEQIGSEFGVDPYVMMAICMGESGGRDITGRPARGLMQIERGGTTEEFIKFGKSRADGPYTEADRSVPSKAIAFATNRIANDLKHYSGDYIKTIQAYNFSRYSLDALLKAFPNGDDWMAQRVNVGKYNGTGMSKYGTPDYVERVLAFYQGNQIPSDGVVTVTGGTGQQTATNSTDNSTEEQQQESGINGFFSDLTNASTNAFNKIYGFDTTTTSTPNNNNNEQPEVTNTSKTIDDWFTDVLGARVSSPYGPRNHPKTGEYKQHTGIDYAALGGTDIPTPIAGSVIYNGYSHDGYGNFLKIKDNNNHIHLFAHMRKKSPLSVGTAVAAGQIVGKVGTTGMSTGDHLHYEVRTKDKSSAHTEPNAYWNKLTGNDKSKIGKSNTTTEGGKGGVDQPIKSPKIPISRKPIGSKEQPVKETNVLDNSKLLAVIIEILHKIANNTSSLSEIVQLLSKSLNVNIPEESLKEIKSNNTSLSEGNKQIVNIIKSSIKNDGNSSGNEYLLKTLEQLALE